MKTLRGAVVSVHAGDGEGFVKPPRDTIEAKLDGIVGDRHRGHARETWSGDKQPKGTMRRNERQWSAVSVEELEDIGTAMGLAAPLDPADLGANLCLSGIAELSRLPKGTLLEFPSGAALLVEEYNPPCGDMGESLAAKYRRTDGEPLAATAFSKAAKLTRGVIGVVEVAGTIRAGDEVTVTIYEPPPWLERSAGQD